MSSLLVVFLFAAASTLLNNNYNKLASFCFNFVRRFVPSKETEKIAKLKKDLIAAKAVLNSISAQDEFAKWAKERRRHDKLSTEFDALNKNQGNDKAAFERSVSWGVWGFMWFLNIFFVFYFRKSAMFYVPHEFVGPFSIVLRLPFAPQGSVSFAFWLFACKNVISKLFSVFAPAKPVAAAASNASEKTVKME
ncbi:GET complex subunit get1 [Chytriomyces hyalinus]|nr:WRB/Get1 family [Chytriomyces cf. hyalinus JEL632]KAJ3405232.1 GET complex subunit get1 [Chytriomyces hyalinus]